MLDIFQPETTYAFKGEHLNELIDKLIITVKQEVKTLCEKDFKQRDASDWIDIQEARRLSGASKTTLRKAFIEDGEPMPGKIRYIRKNGNYNLYNRADIEAWKTFTK